MCDCSATVTHYRELVQALMTQLVIGRPDTHGFVHRVPVDVLADMVSRLEHTHPTDPYTLSVTRRLADGLYRTAVKQEAKCS